MAVVSHKGYEVQKKLGAGAFGTVFKAVNRKTNQLAAVKVIALDKMSKNSREKFLPREIETTINSRHPNLVQVFDIFRANHRLYIFMEFAGNGDLTGFIRKHNGLKIRLACGWFLQASNGLAYLHGTLYTAHRDIKPDNILLSEKWVAKMSDFGFAKESFDRSSRRVLLSSTFCGTLPFECPQILEHKPYDAFKGDIWSMGVTFFIMFHNKFPFNYRDGSKAMLKQHYDYPGHIRSKYERKLPHDANRLCEDMLNPDEGKRCSVKELVSNSYIKNNS